MTQTKSASAKTRPSPTARRSGYVVAVLVNAVLLYAVNNLLAWDILSFLTDDFEQVIPIINVSLGAAILVNLIYLSYDAGWFKSLSQIGLLGISMAATVRLYQVFPFDFGEGSGWTTVTRWVLILAMVGVAIGVIAELGKLVTGKADH